MGPFGSALAFYKNRLGSSFYMRAASFPGRAKPIIKNLLAHGLYDILQKNRPCIAFIVYALKLS
jgi:hypothetical protein